MMMSGLRLEDSTASGKWSFLPRSTSISHLWADCRRFCLAWLWTTGLWPSFTKAMVLSSGLSLAGCFFLLSCSRMSASTANTLSWRHLYLPCVNAVLHPDRMCAIVPLPPHNLHSGSSLIPHLCKLTGVGKVSYTARSRKDIRKGSSRHSSFHVMVLLGRFYLVQAP